MAQNSQKDAHADASGKPSAPPAPNSDPSRMLSKSIAKLLILVVTYIIVLAVLKYIFGYISGIRFLSGAEAYAPYVDIPVSLVFGALIVLEFAQTVYWNLRLKLPHPEAASVRSVFRIIGIVAAVVVVISAYVSPTAAAGLGAFAGLVIGFSTQQVLGQAIAGLFLAISRPFKVDDKVNVANQEGTVVDISSLFTVLDTDQAVILVPNNAIVSAVIKRYKPSGGAETTKDK